jgi:hypothetical protein
VVHHHIHTTKLLAAALRLPRVRPLSLCTALNNLEHLGVDLAKKSTTAKAKEALSWSSKTAKATAPKHRALESSEWSLSRFQPLVHMLLEELIAGSLSCASPRSHCPVAFTPPVASLTPPCMGEHVNGGH